MFYSMRERGWYIDTKIDDSKESVQSVFQQKLSTFLSLVIGVLGKRCGGGMKGV